MLNREVRRLQISFTDIEIFEELMELFRRIYQHEQCTPEMQTYIKLELYRVLDNKKLDLDGLLRKRD